MRGGGGSRIRFVFFVIDDVVVDIMLVEDNCALFAAVAHDGRHFHNVVQSWSFSRVQVHE